MWGTRDIEGHPNYVHYNSRFGKIPLNQHNAHRPLQESDCLDDIFCWQEERTLFNNLTLQYDRIIYLIDDNLGSLKLKSKCVMVHD